MLILRLFCVQSDAADEDYQDKDAVGEVLIPSSPQTRAPIEPSVSNPATPVKANKKEITAEIIDNVLIECQKKSIKSIDQMTEELIVLLRDAAFVGSSSCSSSSTAARKDPDEMEMEECIEELHTFTVTLRHLQRVTLAVRFRLGALFDRFCAIFDRKLVLYLETTIINSDGKEEIQKVRFSNRYKYLHARFGTSGTDIKAFIRFKEICSQFPFLIHCDLGWSWIKDAMKGELLEQRIQNWMFNSSNK